MELARKSVAEMIGTFWLVFAACGAAVMAAGVEGVGIGWFGVAAAFGLVLLTLAYTIGPISGCHVNPAVTIGLCVGKRFPAKEVVPYIVAQTIGAILGAALLYFIASGKAGFEAGGFASNGYGEHSPGGYPLVQVLALEVVATFMFVFIILGVTSKNATSAATGAAIGLALFTVHLVCIPVSNCSVNPARSLGPALFADAWALQQVWAFWAAPIAGGILAGVVWLLLEGCCEAKD